MDGEVVPSLSDVPYPTEAMIRAEAEGRLFNDNTAWQSLWLQDQIWSQTTLELNRGGFSGQLWPEWATHMIR